MAATGHPLGGREYKCRTFLVPNRGDKLFMLATECARVLNYRDSYLLFNKNRSLYKIIATQPEKDDLIHQEILPYSYRSRQIAIVTAKSMFRQFGSRVISNGRRVRDDYWEAKARKQGFTEEDASGEKRPGAAKARDAAASEAANAASVGLGHSDIIYSNGPLDSHGQPQGPQAGPGGTVPASAGPLPMIHLAPRDYGNIPRPRQEISGPPYIERSQPSSAAELLNQATQTAEYSKAINQQRIFRGKGMEDFWNKPRDIPASASQQPAETNQAVSQSLQSPQLATSGMLATGQQSVIQQQSSQIMSPPPYSQQHQGNPLSQSPVRGVPQAMRPEQLHHRSSTLSYPQTGGAGQSTYGYQASHAWGQPPPQPHQSPLSGHHGMPQYSPSAQSHSSHPSQSTHQPPQLHHSQSSGSMHAGMGYQGMGGMSASSYSPMATRGMYQQQSSPSPQQYMQQQQQVQQQQAQQAQQQQTQQQQTQQQQTTATQQAGMQGWAPPQQQPSHHQGWQGY